jgi:plastocyanin
VRAAAVALAAGVLLGACGGSSAAQPAGSMKVTMTEFHFEPSTLSASAGKVVFFLVNGGTISHDMAVRDSTGKKLAASDLISAGDSFVFTVDSIAAGTYTYYCDQPGHEANGMKGTLTVS